jgi:hypothetical protein
MDFIGGQLFAEDLVGLASYTTDSCHTSRVRLDGTLLAGSCIEKKRRSRIP